MIELVVAVILATGISSLCSMTEAMLYSVTWTYIEKQKEKGLKSGKLLYEMRSNVDKPISAVLTLNTVANTAGATIAGALAAKVLGTENLVYFSIVFTIIILLFGEILPKTIGVVYCNGLSRVLVYFLQFIMIVLSPVVFCVRFITRVITSNNSNSLTTEDDIKIMANMSHNSGVIKDYEHKIINNVLGLDSGKVRDVMTPRTVMFSISSEMKISELLNCKEFSTFSRIPIYEKDNRENIIGVVDKKLLIEKVKEQLFEESVLSLSKEVFFVRDIDTLDKVLELFITKKQHLFIVYDEFYSLSGLITLEDIFETLLGKEIVDETDNVEDMRELAYKKRNEKLNK